MNSNTGKLQYLNTVEDFEPVLTDVDHSKKKYMITFPYPYMNGKLHLGHLFSLSKSDFYAYFKRQQGFNTLFPFAFHCTGMPISASAYKLKEELEGRPVDVSIVGLLKGLGFQDVKPFTDPLHWIRTFPEYAISALKSFHAGIDWRRKFITTEINPYYDSFVRYQFNKMKSQGLLDFGKRYSIFCPIDKQACLDHDRRKGEGIKPMAVILRKILLSDGCILLVRGKNNDPIEKLVFQRGATLSKFKHKDRTFMIEKDLFSNLQHQVKSLELISNSQISEIPGFTVEFANGEKKIHGIIKTKTKNNEESGEFKTISEIKNEKLEFVETDNFIMMFVPEDVVISRSGAECIVSLLDQWYIDYSIPEWKEKARKCIKNMTMTNDTRSKITEHLEGLNKWGFSRSFGLGTKIPWDTQYLIDSLSDSTIYNAFYTVKHILFSDIEGKDEIFPTSMLCDDVWKFIFGDIDTVPESLGSQSEILKKCKESFEYFYPVDMRMSGKDLIGNHLLFYIFTHVAIFDEKYWPRGIFTNGHLLLNSAKMSKSDNNFLTVEDCISKYGVSATRVCLANCGDGNDDANFVESVANATILKLYTLTKTVESLDVTTSGNKTLNELISELSVKSGKKDLVDELFVQWISNNINETLKAHEAIFYRDVLKYGFHENLHLIELYKTLGGSNQALVNFGYKTILSLMYPIIPSLANYLIKLKFDGDFSIAQPCTEKNNLIKAFEYVKTICNRIISCKKTACCVEIVVTKDFPEWKRDCMHAVDGVNSKSEIMKKIESCWTMHGIKKEKAMMFSADYFDHKEKYVVPFDEFEILSAFKDFIEKSCEIAVSVITGAEGEPLSPVLKME